MVWFFFMSFHVAILRFAPEGLSLFGGHVTIVKSNKVKESFHEIDKRSHYGTGTEPICHKIWPGSDHLLSGIQASLYQHDRLLRGAFLFCAECRNSFTDVKR